MKTDLSHLHHNKRQELERIVEILLKEFAHTVATVVPPEGMRADGRIVKIVLYGSYARGDWVDDAKGRYFSDFDILVVVNRRYLLDEPGLLSSAEDRIFKTDGLRTPVRFILEEYGELNGRVANNEYFYVDVVSEGIVLYEVPGYDFTRPKNLDRQGRYDFAKKYYEHWMPKAEQFLGTHNLQMKEGWINLAAFSLHQSVEKAYGCLLLVMTYYQPKTHDIQELHKMCVQYDSRLPTVWPGDSQFKRRSFQRLRRAYVDARYSEHYEITGEELDWLRGQVELLHTIVRHVCEDRLKVLKTKAEAG